jgi:hypothetical protein
VLLILVLVAGGLLVAGYGAPVGLGVIVGVLLGAAAMIASLAMSPRTSGSGVWFSSGRMPGQPDHELIMRHGRDAMRVAGVDDGLLRRIVPSGLAKDAGGVRLELVAIELRAAGGIATLVSHTEPPVGRVGHFMDVGVSDDLGTVYVAAGQGSGGSSPSASRHEIRFSPAPPDGARSLTFRIERFLDPGPAAADPLNGPWEFRIEF